MVRRHRCCSTSSLADDRRTLVEAIGQLQAEGGRFTVVLPSWVAIGTCAGCGSVASGVRSGQSS
jgi:hypothetical protein